MISKWSGARKAARSVRALPALPEDQFSFQHHIRKLTSMCNSRSSGSNTFGFGGHLYTYAHFYTQKHIHICITKNKSFFKKI